MDQPTLIIGTEARPFADLAQLAAGLLEISGALDVSFRPCTASWPGHAGFPAVICATPDGDWFATAAIQHHSIEALARAFADVARQEAA